MCDKLYKIVLDPKCGRQLIASRDIKAGECIISEPPIIHGPGYSTSSTNSTSNYCNNGKNIMYNNSNKDPNENAEIGVITTGASTLVDLDLQMIKVCVVCYQNVGEKSSSNTVLCKCDICGLYLCSEMCCSESLHILNECRILQHYPAANFRSFKTLFNFIAVIRCLFCRVRDKVKWKQISALQSKREELESIGAFEQLDTAFNFLNWNMFEDKDNNMEIGDKDDPNLDVVIAAKHSLGVMRINAFSHFSGTWSREGLYFLSSLMSHSCVMNTDRQMDQDGKMIVRAALDIHEGEPITTSYTSYLSNNIERKLELETTWLFSCDCRRCLDFSDECGTFLSNIFCPNCGKDTLQPFINEVENSIVESRTLDKSSSSLWKCSTKNCDSIFPNSKALDILRIVENARPQSVDDNNTEAIEYWLKTYDNGKFLHKNHSIFTQVKFILCQIYGREKEGCDLISSQQLIYKAELCYDLLSIFRCLYPGIYQFRGVILFELWNCINNIVLLSQRETQLVNLVQEKGWTEKHIQDLKSEALGILKYACPNSSEESMHLVILEN